MIYTVLWDDFYNMYSIFRWNSYQNIRTYFKKLGSLTLLKYHLYKNLFRLNWKIQALIRGLLLYYNNRFLTITYTFLSICYLSPNTNHKILRTEHLASNLITREQIFSISYKQFTNTNNWRRLYRSIKYKFRGLGGSRRPFVLSEINLGSFSDKTSLGIT